MAVSATPGTCGLNDGAQQGSRARRGWPFPAHLVEAKAKDATENQLNREVCRGMLTLREAQFIIAADGYKYYREKVLK